MELLFHGNKEEKDSHQPQNSGDPTEGRWSNGNRKRQKGDFSSLMLYFSKKKVLKYTWLNCFIKFGQ